MKCKTLLFFIFVLVFINDLLSQSVAERYKNFGQIFLPQFSSAPFPHPKRMDGHNYKNRLFSFQEHYSDSSVTIFVPNGFKPVNSTNIVLYFHGWNNNIDSASAQFKLIEQFSESNKNAVFVFPEGPKNSPDSYGGRLEETDGLKNLIADVLKFLTEKSIVNSGKIGNIILAGHSGAYRVIAFCLMQGGVTENISDVILFDALYGQTEKYENWIENFTGRFINIYTDSGGTKSETEQMMNNFDSLGVSYAHKEESELSASDLLNNRLIFIHTDLNHTAVIATRKQFLIYLKTSALPLIKN
ncbi:MAG: hypothetical protein COZ80_01595 [Ignavibacteria bacterium CG_4_8_14_3_um_filter_37_9]|nr:hypothetical protein [Ignavibacteria bacterium]OIO21529.1 MAG: hypothetical protein AUJ54_04480 [Ignavibacteria bacterium CG1_02_37_35]PIP77176.1 MAG: hypothetical protein COW85_10310 [Ignavibacteria bacterium CG22_combo_CG10-13_8_21_14_all_37_15]PIS46286.1 MAG: hypothetical protein COT22_00790 [Ignavibacteria bacterium CG08_land_8_20_14_0_20_37_9]PIX00150.1 MAG: hypothetical protein COZ80_01595 [Ignavibacteria bacterium CG_4_8_14_3_um_filter_37_9]PIX93079.1 MAG: hypothetical protein COZ25_